jgi:hypothetical protein
MTTKAKCGCGYTVVIPCNWNKNGRCGIDTKLCKIEDIVYTDNFYEVLSPNEHSGSGS